MAGQAKTAETGVQAGKESTLWRKLARVYVGTTVVAAFMISGVHPSVTLYPVLLQGLYDARGARAVGRSKRRAPLANRYPSLNEDDIDQDDWIGTLKGWWEDIRDYYNSWKQSR